MPKISNKIKHLLEDKDGVKYKYPDRTCKQCRKYPCFTGIENSKCDFAKYGCTKFIE